MNTIIIKTNNKLQIRTYFKYDTNCNNNWIFNIIISTMKNLLYYIFKSYFWSVIAVVIVILFETVIIYYCDNSVDKETPFTSPFIATLICGVLYPVYNLVVIISLYKYRFTPIEVVVEYMFSKIDSIY